MSATLVLVGLAAELDDPTAALDDESAAAGLLLDAPGSADEPLLPHAPNSNVADAATTPTTSVL
jgi:hypothetical protein